MHKKGRTEKAVKNIIFNLLNQFLSLIFALISRSIFIKYLGIVYLGINGIFLDILSILSLADLGFNTAIIYSFYKPLAEKDENKIAALVGYYRKIYLLIGTLIALIGIMPIPFLPKIINYEQEVPYLSLYYLLSLASVITSYLFIYKTSILTADQKGYKITIVTLITGVLKTVLQIISLVLFQSFVIYLVIGITISITHNFIASQIAQAEYSYIRKKSYLSAEEKKSIFNNMGSVVIFKISSVLLNATDNILISVIIGTIFVGLYSNYFILQSKITTIISLVFTSITSSIGNLIVTEKSDRRAEIFRCEQVICFILSGIIIPCYVLLADDFVGIWLGQDFQLGFLMSCAIGINMYLSVVLQPLWTYREATGLYRKTKWVMLFCAFENIILSVVLGITMGLPGIIFASAISRVTTYVWYEPKVLFSTYFNESPLKYYMGLISNTILVTGVVILGYYVFKNFEVTSFGIWILKAILLGGCCLINMILAYGHTAEVKVLRNKLLSMLKGH